MRILFFAMFSVSVFAADTCSQLVDCIELSSKLTGKQYVYSAGDIKAEVKATPGLHWTKENADGLLSEVLHLSGYARLGVPAAANTYSIINARDIRYGGYIVNFNMTKDGGDTLPTPVLPDFAQLHYQSKNGQRVSDIARNLRPFLSRYGRVIDASAGSLIVVDTMTNLERIIGMIRKMDVPMTKQDLVDIERRRKEARQEAKMPFSPSSKTDGPSNPAPQ